MTNNPNRQPKTTPLPPPATGIRIWQSSRLLTGRQVRL
uniref:Uncharacterized protein n=1 Tax=Anguilla anguilla TaxID=7936 RepID=A0A0E9QKP5_ANGAN